MPSGFVTSRSARRSRGSQKTAAIPMAAGPWHPAIWAALMGTLPGRVNILRWASEARRLTTRRVRRLAVCLFLQPSAPVTHGRAHPSDLPRLRPVASELPAGNAVYAGKSLRKDRPVEASVGLRSQSDQLFLAVVSACQDPGEVKVVTSLASAERRRRFGRHGISFREHRPDGQLDRLAFAEVRRQVHHCDLVTIMFRHLE